jgi:methyl-accepting chemotaxis protein
MPQNKVIYRNEDQTNQRIAKIYLYCIALCILEIILAYTGMDTTDKLVIWRDFGTSALLLFTPYFIYFILKKNGPWFKYVILGILIGIQIILYADFEINKYVFILWIMPLLFANMYFDRNLSIIIAGIVLLSINVIDIAHQATIFTPVHVVNGHTEVWKKTDLVADLVFIDMTLSILMLTSINLSGRTKKLLGDLVSTEEKNIILERLARLMKEANQVSSILVQSAKRLSEISSDSKSTNELNAEYSKTTSSSARITLDLVRNSNPLFINLADRVQEIAQYILELNKIATGLNEVTTQGSQAVTQATFEMETITKASQQSKVNMAKLSGLSKQIEQIIRAISAIARQTNLLALNASIEASRAGEQGHGFQVVASSIRDLATQAANATENIRDLVTGIQKEINLSVESIEHEADLVQVGLRVIRKAGEAFIAIATTEDRLTTHANQISAATQEIAANSNQVVTAANEIERQAQIGLTNAENIAAAADQQVAATQELLSQAESVYRIAEKLNMLGRKSK